MGFRPGGKIKKKKKSRPSVTIIIYKPTKNSLASQS